MRYWLIGLVLLLPAQDPVEENVVDLHLGALWKEKGVAPAPRSSDSEFLRRVTLDLVGRIPTADEARAFQEKPDREKKIDELLGSSEFDAFWAERLTASFLGYPRDYEYQANRGGFARWLRQQLESRTGYDSIVRKILTASGDFNSRPEVSFLSQFLAPEEGKYGLKIEELTGKTSMKILGVRISCAQCHDHPHDKWKQDDFYGMLAFFKRTGPGGQGGISNVSADIPYTFEKYSSPLKPRFLDGSEPKSDALREEFARIATTSPQFARGTVNRFWAYLFGRGIVTPYDDFNDKNQPVSEPLLDGLAREFARRKFSVRWLLRTIATSKAYQSSSKGADRAAEKLFARAQVRPLSPEQLFNSIALATDLPKADFNTKAMMRIKKEIQGLQETDTYQVVRRWFIRLLVRTSSADSPEALSDYTANTQQVLHSLNLDSPIFAGAKVDADGRLDRLVESMAKPEAIVRELYWWTLSRPPTERELEVCVAHVHDRGDSNRAYEEVFWALLNADEFVFNH